MENRLEKIRRHLEASEANEAQENFRRSFLTSLETHFGMSRAEYSARKKRRILTSFVYRPRPDSYTDRSPDEDARYHEPLLLPEPLLESMRSYLQLPEEMPIDIIYATVNENRVHLTQRMTDRPSFDPIHGAAGFYVDVKARYIGWKKEISEDNDVPNYFLRKQTNVQGGYNIMPLLPVEPDLLRVIKNVPKIVADHPATTLQQRRI